MDRISVSGIYRKLPGQTAFVGIGGTPGATTQSRRMSFTDATIPTSAAGSGAQYIMQGQRGTLVGDACDAVVVQFGVDGARHAEGRRVRDLPRWQDAPR